VALPRGRLRPAKNKAPIIAKLNQAINAGLADPTIRARLAEVGSVPMSLSPDAFGALVVGQGGQGLGRQGGVRRR
jgi:tripartite-type tricarboxylate transporter receptor subunit TctC